MKKKILILIIVLGALLILVIPVPTAVYKDGGTREFTSLTYKIVDWNRLTPTGTIYKATKVYFFPDNFKSIDNLWYKEKKNVEYSFNAIVLEIYENSVVVEPFEDPILGADKVSFGTSGLEKLDIEVGSMIKVFYTGEVMETYPAQIIATSWSFTNVVWPVTPPDIITVEKPVIYLYPAEKTDVAVTLDFDGKLTCTYPEYNDGWLVSAEPDGTLTDANGQTYNYLYWEGESDTEYDMSQGFCVKGEDTAAFLEDALAKLGLNRREANEFIIYWLPMMQDNAYNIISFQSNAYEASAKLMITPEPDTLIRVFMAWTPADEFVEIKPQELTAPERCGFTAVEWGGTKLN